MHQPNNFGPAGAAVYNSSTLHVGDGTWDASRDTFLLPNIQGLPFDTMRYNGMGNRFRSLPEYHSLIEAHGILAAITFLGVVPAAILIASFYHRNPRLALRIHISLQILTVLLATVILVLGYFAVGPERSLTNPHHGIGVAIYVLVLIQAIGGWLIHKIEKGKTRYYIPIKLMLHQWIGRGIALLALAQIPIGLTLYGSPLVLFILYAVVMFIFVSLYFILTYQHHRRIAAAVYDGRGSHVTGTQTDLTGSHSEPHHGGRWAALTGALAGGAGLEALRRRRSRGREASDNKNGADGSVVYSGTGSESYLTEKYSENRPPEDHTWQDRFLGGIAGLGGLAAFRRFRDRKKNRKIGSEVSSYRPPPTESLPPVQTRAQPDSMERLEEGIPVRGENDNWRRVEELEAAQEATTRRPEFRSDVQSNLHSDLHSRRSRDSFGTNDSHQRQEQTGSRPFARLAELTGIGGYLQRRRERKEKERVEAERQVEFENERVFGQQQEQQPLYPGDGTPRRGGVRFDPDLPSQSTPGQPVDTYQDSVMSPVSMNSYADRHPVSHQPYPPSPYGASRSNIPPPPRPMDMRGPGEGGVPPPPPAHQETSKSRDLEGPPPQGPPRANVSRGNTLGPNREMNGNARSSGTQSGSSSNENVNSPPVSVKVKMHNDGRHVTLRRLNEEEATEARGTRRQDNNWGSQTGSPGRVNNGQSPASLNRERTAIPETLMTAEQSTPGGQPGSLFPGSPQPGYQPSPPSAYGGTRSSPATAPSNQGYDTGSDNYDTNRRRRRAERARAEQARQAAAGGGGGNRVEFT